jgi:hypothetical protein
MSVHLNIDRKRGPDGWSVPQHHGLLTLLNAALHAPERSIRFSPHLAPVMNRSNPHQQPGVLDQLMGSGCYCLAI